MADLPASALQDPIWFRTGHQEKGRDGCRVPLPWTADEPQFGFGTVPTHLPQPEWFAGLAANVQDSDASSTLALYSEALRLRRELQTSEKLEWVGDGCPAVLHFVRPGGWHSITNFGDDAVNLPVGDVMICSAPLTDGMLPGNATAWLFG